nr:copia protein [Tanacetum cinerariifolium]
MSYEGVFLGYSQNSKAYIILNKHTMKIKESLNVTFDETPPPSKTSLLVDDDLDEVEAVKITKKKNLENNIEHETLVIDEIVNVKESRNHPLENVIENLNQRTLRNKLDENGIVSRNKAKLVAQGYNQQKGIDYDETYAVVARLESIRILLAHACGLDFKILQMDVKSAFITGLISEEVYMAQPPGFIDFEKPGHVYKLKKALYGLKQAPKACVCLCARFQEDPKTSYLEAVKRIFRYIKGTTHLGLWYPKGTDIETIVYADYDHAGDYVHRKSTSGICTFMGCCLTYWFSKKQTVLVISTTKAEYISARKARQQSLWMKQAIVDYDVRLDHVPIICDNKGAIDLSKITVQHSLTKHIEIRHHFLRDNVHKGHILIEKVSFVDNKADILPNPSNVNLQLRKTRKDRGMRRGRYSTSSSSAIDQPYSSHFNDDGNDVGTSQASTLFPTRFVNSLTNKVPRVFENPPNIDPSMEVFYTLQTKILNRSVQLRYEHRGGLRSIEKGIKNLLKGNK